MSSIINRSHSCNIYIEQEGGCGVKASSTFPATPRGVVVSQRFMKGVKPYLFLMPILVFAVGFVYYPFMRTLIHSFSVVNAKGQIVDAAGFNNFHALFSRSVFNTALRNSLTLTLLNVPITLVITLSLALLANKKRRFGSVYETMFTLPMAISMSMAALIFRVLLNPTVGYLNYAMGLSLNWFNDSKVALYGILIVTLWMGIAFDFLLFLSAVRGIPDQLIEAATIDGAGPLTKLLLVRLPLLTPTIFFVVCTNMVLAMMTAGPVMIITQGGPARSTTTLIYLMFTLGYESHNYSLAACISIVSFVLTSGLMALAFIFESKVVHYD